VKEKTTLEREAFDRGFVEGQLANNHWWDFGVGAAFGVVCGLLLPGVFSAVAHWFQ
jgi:ElaB/YqjD/DUF883 family membrane-anchored ribosome-binding protein